MILLCLGWAWKDLENKENHGGTKNTEFHGGNNFDFG